MSGRGCRREEIILVESEALASSLFETKKEHPLLNFGVWTSVQESYGVGYNL
jgi:hypothetical protein